MFKERKTEKFPDLEKTIRFQVYLLILNKDNPTLTFQNIKDKEKDLKLLEPTSQYKKKGRQTNTKMGKRLEQALHKRSYVMVI